MRLHVGGEWYRKHHRGALAHSLHVWLEGRNGTKMEASCGKDIRDEDPLVSVEAPIITPYAQQAYPTGYCRGCFKWHRNHR